VTDALLVLATFVACFAVAWGVASLLSLAGIRAIDAWTDRLKVTDPDRYTNIVMLREARNGR
jgi:hypothetical protein